jgi:8-oxo-dGTP diphosphatase
VSRHQLDTYAFPSANRAILTALRLPERLLVTGAFDHPRQCLQRVEHAMTQHGIRAVLLRAHDLDTAAYRQLAAALSDVCHRHAALLLLNTDSSGMLEQADGLHLTAQRLMACQTRPVAAGRLLGASCHNPLELQQALAIGVDYVTLSPVQATASHPGEPCLGWDGFKALQASCPVPAFALGGIGDTALPQVKALGGFGIAALSAWW